MHYFTFADKDTTIYQGNITSSQNTGLDGVVCSPNELKPLRKLSFREGVV